MTTQAIISSPKPNHQRVRVRTFYLGQVQHTALLEHFDVTNASEVVLEPGESTAPYIHGASVVLIDEVE